MPAAPESFVVCVPLLKRPLSVCARQNARSRKADSSVHGKSKQTQRVYSSVQGTAARAASQLSTHAHGDAFVCPGILRTLVQRGIFEEGSGGLPLDTGGLRKISHHAGELAAPSGPLACAGCPHTRASAGQPASRSSLSELHLKKVLVQPRSQSALPWGADESGAPPHDLIADGGPPAQMREAWQEPAADAAPAATT